MKFELTEKYCVYVDRTDEGREYYVGKGVETRVNKRDRNALHRNISVKEGLNRSVEFETSDEQEAYRKEAELNALYKTWVGYKTGGANLDMGGVGGPSTPKTDVHRQRIGAAQKGKPKSVEHCEAMSRGGKGKVLTPSHRKKICLSGKRALQNNPTLLEARKRGARIANQRRWEAYRRAQAVAAAKDAADTGATSDVNA